VGRESQDGIALPRVIDGLREKGFVFKRIDAARQVFPLEGRTGRTARHNAPRNASTPPVVS
jgi:hypothetical protein